MSVSPVTASRGDSVVTPPRHHHDGGCCRIVCHIRGLLVATPPPLHPVTDSDSHLHSWSSSGRHSCPRPRLSRERPMASGLVYSGHSCWSARSARAEASSWTLLRLQSSHADTALTLSHSDTALTLSHADTAVTPTQSGGPAGGVLSVAECRRSVWTSVAAAPESVAECIHV